MWLVNSYIPMEARIKNILNIVVIIGVLLLVLNAFGVFRYLGNFNIPTGRN
jgi:1-acyl-sn-glycerol-3-phosphate acyltransferase